MTTLNRVACFQSEIRCTKDGAWTTEFTMCSKLQGLCPSPTNLNSIEYSCDQGRDVGEWNLKVSHTQISDITAQVTFLIVICMIYCIAHPSKCSGRRYMKIYQNS